MASKRRSLKKKKTQSKKHNVAKRKKQSKISNERSSVESTTPFSIDEKKAEVVSSYAVGSTIPSTKEERQKLRKKIQEARRKYYSNTFLEDRIRDEKTTEKLVSDVDLWASDISKYDFDRIDNAIPYGYRVELKIDSDLEEALKTYIETGEIKNSNVLFASYLKLDLEHGWNSWFLFWFEDLPKEILLGKHVYSIEDIFGDAPSFWKEYYKQSEKHEYKQLLREYFEFLFNDDPVAFIEKFDLTGVVYDDIHESFVSYISREEGFEFVAEMVDGGTLQATMYDENEQVIGYTTFDIDIEEMKLNILKSYIEPEFRGLGLFPYIRREVINFADKYGLTVTTIASPFDDKSISDKEYAKRRTQVLVDEYRSWGDTVINKDGTIIRKPGRRKGNV